MKVSIAYAATLCTLAGQAHAVIELDLTSKESIKKAASTAAFDMMTYYTGNRTGDTPGNLPDPYYWWECGAMFGTMINYWYYTGDTTYNDVTQQALLHQAGDDHTFMPDNQTKTLGNDDQAFWALAAMTAAETKFQDPPAPSPGWLAMAQGVFNTQYPRWDNSTCGGGLRWQIFTFNAGYTYKNSISNGCFFNLAARLALYTGNQTYADWAIKAFEWSQNIGLVDGEYKVYDGTQNTDNCTDKDRTRWTYNTGVYLLGAAAMYNFTNGSAIWEERTKGFVDASNDHFKDNIMFEPCENNPADKPCNVDQRSFKAYLTRWIAAAAELAPFTHDLTIERIQTSAKAAVKTCNAGAGGTQCGLKWTTGTNDGSLGVGEQMAVLEIIQSNLVDDAPGWVSDRLGTGSSQGDVNAGVDHVDNEDLRINPATTGDRVGAGILTALVLIGVVSGTAVMVIN